jgi:hypothetical protein
MYNVTARHHVGINIIEVKENKNFTTIAKVHTSDWLLAIINKKTDNDTDVNKRALLSVVCIDICKNLIAKIST